MKTHMFDKVLSFGLVIAGLLFLILDKQAATGNLYMVGVIVIVGGVLGLVNAQMLAPVLQLLEKNLGVPLANPSAAGSATPSAAALPTSSTNTSQTQNISAPGTVAK